MGGNAFKNFSVVRLEREHIEATVDHVVNTLSYPSFDFEYAMANVMGSVGKQPTSGDLDFAINTYRPTMVGEEDHHIFNFKHFADHVNKILPEDHTSMKTFKSGQFQTIFHQAGDPNLGFVQVDFVCGKLEWLHFTHWSPGLDVSPYKGAMISTMLGVLAKMHKEFEAFDADGRRVARVGLHFDLEKGLHRKWQLSKDVYSGLSNVEPDHFETRVDAPRFGRMGYVTSPEVVLEMLLGSKVELSDVDTLEKLIYKIKELMPERFDEAKERFIFTCVREKKFDETVLEGLF